MDFTRLCGCSPAEFDHWRRCVEACAAAGRSYELPWCTLPAGCTPARASIGVWRQGGYYFLYFRPAVEYIGDSESLRVFFREGRLQRYDSFDALTRRLSALAPASCNLFPALLAGLRSKVAGQESALEGVAFKLAAHVGKTRPARPLSLVFYGPTGVGKSELAKAIAPALNACLGRERYRAVWTELNTFTEAHSAYRLTGAPPGYAGYDDMPILEQVRQCPHTVFLFDELDKAHPEVLKVFMSILDEGRCAARQEDKSGSWELDFRRCVFIFTTNFPLDAPPPRLGFAPPPVLAKCPPRSGGGALAERLFLADESARRAMVSTGVLVEIAGRFSGLIGFASLSQSARRQVTALQIAALGREYGLEVSEIEAAVLEALTPEEAFSQRSVAGVLEGVLCPVFLRAPTGIPLRLAVSQTGPVLLPAAG